ncbi:MAG: hypothetical protein Q4G16_06225 [Cruoricaptor ignavus]|nr:hypothetical protein [Cruoricaptor ignavus]
MDKKFKSLKIELIQKGLSEKNFEYVYQAVKSGTKRNLIYKNLTSDIRKVEPNFANEILNKFFALNGGEFKYENRTGYLYSVAYIIIAIASLLFTIAMLNGAEGRTRNLILAIIGFLFFSYKAITTILKSMRGKYRED